MPAEENPFLGLRGVRLSLAHQEIFEAQLRALARAAAEYPNVRIMIPMVSQLEELAHVREIATAVAAGVPLALGVMIEVPSAALLAREFAANADFLSVGSNDLTAYLMAADRNNEHVEHLYNELNPAVIRMLAHIAAAGSESSTPVSICGELAGEPRTLPLLVGLGLRNISVAPGLVPRLKAQIRELDTRLLAEPAEEALRARSASEMQILTAQLNSLTGAQG